MTVRAMNGDSSLSGIGWPVDRVYLAGLIELGLSDARIAACFSVDARDVETLRKTYNLSPAAADGILQSQMSPSAALALDELSNDVQAAVTYVSAAIKCVRRDASPDATSILLMEKSLEQLLRIGRAYQSLQARIRPASE